MTLFDLPLTRSKTLDKLAYTARAPWIVPRTHISAEGGAPVWHLVYRTNCLRGPSSGGVYCHSVLLSNIDVAR